MTTVVMISIVDEDDNRVDKNVSNNDDFITMMLT